MPAIDSQPPDISSKAMNRRMSRSAITFAVKRANYMRFVLPKVERAICALNESLHALTQPIEIVVGRGDNKAIAHVIDYQSQAKIAGALFSAMEFERQLLGFPSPGKRRDEGAGEMRQTQSPGIVDVAQVQAATATASEAEQAEPSIELKQT